MGLLDRAIKKGISNAIGNAVEKAVAPKIEQATAGVVNQAAASVNQAVDSNVQSAPPPDTAQTEERNQAAHTLGGLFGSWQGAAASFANEAAKNMKICPSCGESASAATKFCPSCGAGMPEETVAQGAVCSSCGKQNDIGGKFCADCGAKLPAAVAEERAARTKTAALMAQWDALLPHYPKWSFGGTDMELEDMGVDEGGNPFYGLHIRSTGRAALEQYRNLLRQNGFREAGKYPSSAQLYKMTDGVCRCFNSEEAFAGGDDCLSVYFQAKEPEGGFHYAKPEPQAKAKSGFFDLFK